MRIIAGQWRGRRLTAPDGVETRPTADRVRETLFNMLASRLGSFQGLRVADLFAGSGALGFEALSRGAEFAFFVDRASGAVAAIRANARALGAGDKAQIVQCAVESLPGQQAFNLVLADPPYSAGSGTNALQSILQSHLVGSGSWVAIESGRRDPVDPQGLTVEVERDLAKARLTLLRA